MNDTELSKLKELTKFIEGFSKTVYKDTEGYLTVGYGHKLLKNELYDYNLKEGSKADDVIIESWFLEDINVARNEIKALIKDIDKFESNLKVVLTYLLFNLGMPRFSLFKNTIKKANHAYDEYVRCREDYLLSVFQFILELANSKWATQVPRACRIITNYLMLGKFSEEYILLKDLDKRSLYWWSQNKDTQAGTEKLLKASFFYTSKKDIDLEVEQG